MEINANLMFFGATSVKSNAHSFARWGELLQAGL